MARFLVARSNEARSLEGKWLGTLNHVPAHCTLQNDFFRLVQEHEAEFSADLSISSFCFTALSYATKRSFHLAEHKMAVVGLRCMTAGFPLYQGVFRACDIPTVHARS